MKTNGRVMTVDDAGSGQLVVIDSATGQVRFTPAGFLNPHDAIEAMLAAYGHSKTDKMDLVFERGTASINLNKEVAHAK